MTNWIIYKLTCETGKTYIGKTCMTMNRRLTKHKGRQNKESNSSTKDFINPTIHLIEEYPCHNNIELSLKEKEWILKTNCVNVKINPIIEQIDTTDNKETSFYLEQHHIRQNIDCCNIVKLLSKEEKIIRKAEVSKKYSQTEKGKISMTLCKKRWYEKHKDVLNEKLRVKRLLKKNILI